MVRIGARAYLLAAVVAALGVGAASAGWADCSSPSGSAGKVVYASNVNSMVFCDGANWVSMAGGVSVTIGGTTNTPGGADTYVQYNSGGSAFGGSSAFTWNNATSTLTATNIAGTLATAGQPNITSVGTLTGLTVSGAASLGSLGVGSINASGLVSATNISVTALTVNGVAISGSSGGDRIVSGTSGVYANTIGGYISLTTGSITWGYLGSSATYLPNLRAGAVSSSAGVQVGSVATTCATGISGTIRYNTSSNTMEYCNSTAWANLGPSATTPVAFSVNKGGVDQSGIADSTLTKVTWSTELFDTNNNFVNGTFTPTVPGKYFLSAALRIQGMNASGYIRAYIYKNGTPFAECQNISARAENYHCIVTTIVDANGSSDNFEVYAWQVSGLSLSIGGNSADSYFVGALLSPQGGGSGGTATPSGSTADVQYNSGGALAADTGNFTYASGVLKAPTVSATAVTAKTVQIGGDGTEGCSGSVDYGKMRVNPITHRMQVCKP